MTVLRAIAVVLMLMVSPLGMTVCEVTCSAEAHHGVSPAVVETTSAAATEDCHEHQTTSAPPVAPSDAPVAAPDASSACDPLPALVARVRAVAVHDMSSTVASSLSLMVADHTQATAGARAVPGPPPPLRPSLISLRI